MTARIAHIVVPYLGAAVEEGTVIAWRKGVGDTVAEGEPVCDIATDKVDMEIEAPAAGVIARVLVAEDESAPIGATLAEIAPPGTEPAPAAEAAPPGRPAEPEEEIELSGEVAEPAMVAYVSAGRAAGAASGEGAPAAIPPGRFDPALLTAAVLERKRPDGSPLASPLARRIAAEHEVDIGRVEGTGARGRIRKDDVFAALEALRAAPAAEPEAAAAVGPVPLGYEAVPHDLVPLSRLRRSIAEHMVRSRQTAAHATTIVEVDLHRAEATRRSINERRGQADQRRLSILPFVARAASATLGEFPDLNATYTEQGILRWREVNLGIAVDAPHGLLVPVVRRAETLTVEALGDAIVDAALRTREGAAQPDDLAGGTFTISSVGPMGATAVVPTINQPQVAILGMPAILKRPVVVSGPGGEDVIAIHPVIQLSLTFDHRAVDGAEATRCVVRIKELLEAWGEEAYR